MAVCDIFFGIYEVYVVEKCLRSMESLDLFQITRLFTLYGKGPGPWHTYAREPKHNKQLLVRRMEKWMAEI